MFGPGGFLFRNRDPIARRKDRHDQRKCGRVRIVTVHTNASDTPALREVPVTVHSAMQPHLVIAPLRAMTLRAEGHDIRKLDRARIRKPQRVVVIRIVTTQTGEIAVIVLQPLVKLIKFGGTACLDVRLCGRVAGTARSRDSLAMNICQPGPDFGGACIRFENDRMNRGIAATLRIGGWGLRFACVQGSNRNVSHPAAETHRCDTDQKGSDFAYFDLHLVCACFPTERLRAKNASRYSPASNPIGRLCRSGGQTTVNSDSAAKRFDAGNLESEAFCQRLDSAKIHVGSDIKH